MSLVRIFAVPAVLGLLAAVGLVSALVGDGLFDAVSWICLGAPLAIAAIAVARRAR